MVLRELATTGELAPMRQLLCTAFSKLMQINANECELAPMRQLLCTCVLLSFRRLSGTRSGSLRRSRSGTRSGSRSSSSTSGSSCGGSRSSYLVQS